LGVGRDAGIAVNHASIAYQKSASEKSKHINVPILMQIDILDYALAASHGWARWQDLNLRPPRRYDKDVTYNRS
jgi:hypothetical protein